MTHRKNICTIVSHDTRPRVYEVDTDSAMKCAWKYGRRQHGEVVTVSSREGKLLSRVKYAIEEHDYYHVHDYGRGM